MPKNTAISPKDDIPDHPVSILFVCLGNICRSPMAEAVFKSQTKGHPGVGQVDSCGTAGYHVLEPPDFRAMSKLRQKGITDFEHSGRQIASQDFHDYDYILGMDEMNMESLARLRGRRKSASGGRARVMLFGEFAGKNRPEEVVDPYYGGQDGFEVVYGQLVRFTKGFVDEVADKVAEKLKGEQQ
ncbi:MAG: hypothetical protein M1834_007749 [Cirrosporium novae-zelandiae]|nr:MAG: hypothetical protein M1834_007749 [Cirrosporium novae-zelandiae]